LIPIFSSGRAQELQLIVEEYWAAHPELQDVPVYFVSNLAKKCTSVYQGYINMMNAKIQRQFFKGGNPFFFKFIKFHDGTTPIYDNGPCVMMASPGMLQSGTSRRYFEEWCTNPLNRVIIPGYCVEGTLANVFAPLFSSSSSSLSSSHGTPHLLSGDLESSKGNYCYGWQETPTQNEGGLYILLGPRRRDTESCLHQRSESIEPGPPFPFDYHRHSYPHPHFLLLLLLLFFFLVLPPFQVLVHGDSYGMNTLKLKLEEEFRSNEKHIPIFTPANTTTVTLDFKGETSAKVIGTLAASKPGNGQTISGVVVTKDFETGITSPEDLIEYDLTTSLITMKLVVPYYGTSLSLLKYHLNQMFQSVVPVSATDPTREGLRVFDAVSIFPFKENSVILEWLGNAMNDTIADSVLSIIMGVEKVPSSIKGKPVGFPARLPASPFSLSE